MTEFDDRDAELDPGLRRVQDVLRRKPEGTLSNQALENSLQRMLASAEETRAGRSGVAWRWVAAASVLLGLSLAATSKFRGGAATPGDAGSAAVVKIESAEDAFRVLRTQPERNSAVVQPFATFEVELLHRDDAVGGYSLVAVEEDALRLRDGAGTVARKTVVEINDSAEAQLARELKSFEVAQGAGTLSAAHLDRLSLIALHGETGALRILEEVSTGASPLRDEARARLSASRELSSMQQLIGLSMSASGDARRQAMSALARSGSPLALRALRDICLGEDEGMARYAVQALAAHGGAGTLEALRAASESAASAAVREKSAAAVDAFLTSVGE